MLSAQPSLLNTSKGLSTSVTRVAPQSRNVGERNTQLSKCTLRPIARDGRARAVIGEEKSTAETLRFKTGGPDLSSSEAIDVTAVITIRKRTREKLLESVQEEWQSFINGIGKGIVVRLISEETDPVTKAGKASEEASVRGWLPRPSIGSDTDEFTANFKLPSGFGRPGAVLVTNLQNKEFFLLEIVVYGFATGPLFFPANTWIHPRKHSQQSRTIFTNKAYLPSQTPDGLKDLRQRGLTSLRGDGRGERRKYDRIYDYDVYNDLGKPDEDIDLARPILGGEQMPYPRRCRTGRPPSKSDPTAESRIEKPDPVYVPRDETFEEIKKADFSAGRLKGVLHNLIPTIINAVSLSDGQFRCFTEIDDLYRQGVDLCKEQGGGPVLAALTKKFFNIGERLLKFKLPLIISSDRFSWLRDNEFGRQALAGVNPASIERLREFPIRSKLDPAVYGPPESAITKEILERGMNGMSVEEAIEQHRLFIIDYHDVLLPFIEKLNSQEDLKSYATRTVLFYNKACSLIPIAVELSLPPSPSSPQTKKVYTGGHSATTNWMWRWAKAHVCSNDAGIHQLVHHWLRTHACMEAYTIAANRQLSAMHPVFKLLDPHMRYTLEINALARQALINGGGVIEECFFSGKHSMEISAAAYDSMWRFDMEGLPADLLGRGMAVEDPSMPCGVRLVIEDYPYAADGLLVWSAIKDWVHDYVNNFYPDDGAVASDVELQGWWDEVRNKGHADKRNAAWWPTLRTVDDLKGVLTTIIWTASGQHAAVNFGQYPFGGYMPNRPTLMKKLIPDEDDPEYEWFIRHPQFVFLSALPSLLQATKVMSVQDTLSTHSPDEEYLGQLHDSHAHWIDDKKILELYRDFSSRLEEADRIIHERNQDERLTNRNGAGVPPYELLRPTSKPGVTGRGVPNSVSI